MVIGTLCIIIMLLQKLVLTIEFLLHVVGSSRYERKQPKKITYLTRLSYPRGMVISQEGHLIVTRYDSITIINTDSGEVINRFGQQGSGQVEFRGPAGLSLTQDGHIIVADQYNNRLQVLFFLPYEVGSCSSILCMWWTHGSAWLQQYS